MSKLRSSFRFSPAMTWNCPRSTWSRAAAICFSEMSMPMTSRLGSNLNSSPFPQPISSTLASGEIKFR